MDAIRIYQVRQAGRRLNGIRRGIHHHDHRRPRTARRDRAPGPPAPGRCCCTNRPVWWLSRLVLVAVHPWDVHGAARSGLRTVWLNRTGGSYPSYFQAPEFTVTALTELPSALTAAC